MPEPCCAGKSCLLTLGAVVSQSRLARCCRFGVTAAAAAGSGFTRCYIAAVHADVITSRGVLCAEQAHTCYGGPLQQLRCA